MLKAAIMVLLASAAPAQACHRFAYWRYPFPQRCVTHRVTHIPVVHIPITTRSRVVWPSLHFDELIGGDAPNEAEWRARTLLKIKAEKVNE